MKSFKNKNTYSLVHIKQKKLEYLFVFLLTFYEGYVMWSYPKNLSQKDKEHLREAL